MIVIKFEVAYEDDEAGTIPEGVERILDEARSYGAARVVGSYHQPGAYHDKENEEWRAQMVDYIDLPASARIKIDD